MQNSLEIMISSSQQQFNDQASFFKNQQLSFGQPDVIPKTIEQVFALYQDRFTLCSKISQQNRFLKEKITEI